MKKKPKTDSKDDAKKIKNRKKGNPTKGGETDSKDDAKKIKNRKKGKPTKGGETDSEDDAKKKKNRKKGKPTKAGETDSEDDAKKKKNRKKGKPTKAGEIDPDGDPPVNNDDDSDGDDAGPTLQYINGELYLTTANDERYQIFQIPAEEAKSSCSLFRKHPAKSVNENWYGLELKRNTICTHIAENLSRFGWIHVDYDFVKRVNAKALNKHFLNANRDGMRESEEETLLLAYQEDNEWFPTGT